MADTRQPFADFRPCPDCGAPQVRSTATGVYLHVHSLRQAACDRPKQAGRRPLAEEEL